MTKSTNKYAAAFYRGAVTSNETGPIREWIQVEGTKTKAIQLAKQIAKERNWRYCFIVSQQEYKAIRGEQNGQLR